MHKEPSGPMEVRPCGSSRYGLVRKSLPPLPLMFFLVKGGIDVMYSDAFCRDIVYFSVSAPVACKIMPHAVPGIPFLVANCNSW